MQQVEQVEILPALGKANRHTQLKNLHTKVNPDANYKWLMFGVGMV